MILPAESDLFVFIHLDNRLEPVIYFIAQLVVCQSDVTVYGLPLYRFLFVFCFVSPTILRLFCLP